MGKPWEIHAGDVRHVCKQLDSNSFDALLCDPPYGLRFMGRRWDYSVPSSIVWDGILRVMKPGAHAIIFGGSRTFHRLACAMEDAGFEIRDTLCWLYGSGFPKSHDVSKAIVDRLGHVRPTVGSKKGVRAANGSGHGAAEPNRKKVACDVPITDPVSDLAVAWRGYGTALKPAWEPALLARKYLEGTVAENVERWGVGGIAIDEGRIGVIGGPADHAFERLRGNRVYGVNRKGKTLQLDAGRWPANVMLDEQAARDLDEQSGERPGMSGGGKHRPDYAGGMFGAVDSETTARGDSGGASRFFYTAKADRYQRESGLEGREATVVGSLAGGGIGAVDPVSKRFTKVARNTHTTVKPIDLIRYFAALILPPKRGTPRRIIVPFSGSGSEMIGCLQAGWDEVVGVEREAEYVEIAKARIARGGVYSRLVDKRMRERETGSRHGRTSRLRKVRA
jgi:DNA modification methylase